MKKVFAAVLVAVLVVTIGLIAFAGPTFHVKKLTYVQSIGERVWVPGYYVGNVWTAGEYVNTVTQETISVVAPGFGVTYLGNTAWGFGADYTFTGLVFNSEVSGCDVCDDGEWIFGSLGMLVFGPFYDFAIGGCDPGPCDKGVIRLGAGVGVPMVFWLSNQNGIWLESEGTGLALSASYIWPKDFSVKGEAYWDGDNFGYGIGLHVDLFSLGGWIRGNEDNGQTLDDLLDG